MTELDESLTLDLHDVAIADEESLQDQGAVGGEPAGRNPTTHAQPLDPARSLPSTRGGGGGGRSDADLEEARRNADRHRREREETRRALDDARRRQDQQDALIDRLTNELRELQRERFRDVRESPTENFGLSNRGGTRIRATEQSEVSGRLESACGRVPVTSTPSRVVGFDLDDKPSPAASAAADDSSTGPRTAVAGDNASVPAAAPSSSTAPATPNTSGGATLSGLGDSPGGYGDSSRGPLIKIGSYNGETDLTAFLSKFGS